MSLQILPSAADDRAVIIDGTRDWAFGPVFDSSTAAEAFLTWLAPRDIRHLDEGELKTAFHLWYAQLHHDCVGSRFTRFVRACRNAIRCGYDHHDARFWARDRVRDRTSFWGM